SPTVTITVAPATGTLTPGSDGSFVYVPQTGYAGVVTFKYTFSVGSAYSNEATATIEITNVAPWSAGDVYQVTPGTTLNVSAANGVLANDFDPDGDSITMTVTHSPTHGNLTPNADGSFSYAPYSGYTGEDTFFVTASDGLTAGAEAAVQLVVAAAPS